MTNPMMQNTTFSEQACSTGCLIGHYLFWLYPKYGWHIVSIGKSNTGSHGKAMENTQACKQALAGAHILWAENVCFTVYFTSFAVHRVIRKLETFWRKCCWLQDDQHLVHVSEKDSNLWLSPIQSNIRVFDSPPQYANFKTSAVSVCFSSHVKN